MEDISLGRLLQSIESLSSPSSSPIAKWLLAEDEELNYAIQKAAEIAQEMGDGEQVDISQCHSLTQDTYELVSCVAKNKCTEGNNSADNDLSLVNDTLEDGLHILRLLHDPNEHIPRKSEMKQLLQKTFRDTICRLQATKRDEENLSARDGLRRRRRPRTNSNDSMPSLSSVSSDTSSDDELVEGKRARLLRTIASTARRIEEILSGLHAYNERQRASTSGDGSANRREDPYGRIPASLIKETRATIHQLVDINEEEDRVTEEKTEAKYIALASFLGAVHFGFVVANAAATGKLSGAALTGISLSLLGAGISLLAAFIASFHRTVHARVRNRILPWLIGTAMILGLITGLCLLWSRGGRRLHLLLILVGIGMGVVGAVWVVWVSRRKH